MTPEARQVGANHLHRLLRRVEDDEALDRLAKRAAHTAAGVLDRTRTKQLLTGSWLGHAFHPVLTDFADGAWMGASFLDVFGPRGAEPAARRLVGFGLLAAVPTAATGIAEWADTDRKGRRVGLLHLATSSSAFALYASSYLARRRGRQRAGVVLGVVGGVVAIVDGYVGGHLSLVLGVGVGQTAFTQLPGDWTVAGRAEELDEGRPSKAVVDETEIVLVRIGDEIFALANRCTYRGGQLHEGQVRDRAIVCPRDGCTFRLHDGAVLRGPASIPQPALDVRVEEGRVEVREKPSQDRLSTALSGKDGCVGSGEDRLAKALGWFSIGLGVPQLLAPRQVNRLIGIDDTRRNRAVMRAVGLRELGGAAGILDRPRPAGFLFARVAGDAMDLGLLGAALRKKGNARRRVATASAAVAGVAVVDVLASVKTRRSSDPATSGNAIGARTAITVNRPLEEVYRYWRRLENLPDFMYHLESVQAEDSDRSRWVAKAPAGATVEWEARIEQDVPNEVISWRSLEGADVANSGSVRFRRAPGDRGTEVTLELEYEPPGGAVGGAVARLFGEEPVQQVKDDLRRFKQVMETGEVVRSEGTPQGTRTQAQLSQAEAQPRP